VASTRFHFVDDYRKLVADLIAQYPLAEAMSRAVGGSFDALGEIEKQLLIGYGLRPEHVVADVGCGSGRLACALAPYLTAGHLLGTDVVQELLDYARERCPATWEFTRVEGIRIPLPRSSADFACFFSVFTHLLHEETYYYLLEAQRVVKPGGRIVFSFLEFEHNWSVFEATYTARMRKEPTVHLNMFIGRDAIAAWARHLDMTIVDIRAATDPFIKLSRPIVYDDGRRVEGFAALGQSVCVLSNDKPANERKPSPSQASGARGIDGQRA
jgi:ubiquinone/menaquinone biosynthesis C-methylase UbiE